ncbi:MAG: hypothetical protein M3P34_10600 [Actinomycetota bacterium]|nr:hypothetical protein [Actinomycetota bacterium]
MMVGVAQERVSGWRGFRRGGSDSHPHFVYRRQSLSVNHYYFYLWDAEWAPGFIKVCPYAPYPVWAWVNGHEWLKRQLAQRSVGFDTIDNGIRSCDDLPSPAVWPPTSRPATRAGSSTGGWACCPPRSPPPIAGPATATSSPSASSSTPTPRCSTGPGNGRAWFEAAIRDHLDLGRPERVSLVVDRRINRRTPGRFATKVVSRGVDPQIQIHYRASNVKAYFKESRALRVETTVNNPDDFGVKRTLNADNFAASAPTATHGSCRRSARARRHRLTWPPSSRWSCRRSTPTAPGHRDSLRGPPLSRPSSTADSLLRPRGGWAHQCGALPAHDRPPGSALHPPPGHLRPASTPAQGFHHPSPRPPPLSGHPPRTGTRLLAHQGVGARGRPRPQRARRHHSSAPRTQRPIVTAWRNYERELYALLRAADIAA